MSWRERLQQLRPPSWRENLILGCGFLALGAIWLTVAAIGRSDVFHLVAGFGWLTIAVAHLSSAVIRYNRQQPDHQT